MVFSFPNGLQFFYSYSTLVAFESTFSGLVVQKNSWSTTTGKHLNWIDDGDKKSRVDAETFEKKLAETMSHYGMGDERCKVIGCGELLYGRVRTPASQGLLLLILSWRQSVTVFLSPFVRRQVQLMLQNVVFPNGE